MVILLQILYFGARVTNAIKYVTADTLPVVYTLEGHMESLCQYS